MNCNFKKDNCEKCKFNLKSFGTCEPARIIINGSDRTQLNWSEISVPEVLQIPIQKPDIEQIDQVYVDAKLNEIKLIETPFAYKSYDREANQFEIDSTKATFILAYNVVNESEMVLTNAKEVLSLDLPVIIEVSEFQSTTEYLEDSLKNLRKAIEDANNLTTNKCISAEEVVDMVKSVLAATEVLERTLKKLSLVGINLEKESDKQEVTDRIKKMEDSIILVLEKINISQVAIKDVIVLIGKTKYFEIMENEEGVCLSGRKLVIQGVLSQKVVYTGLVTTQSVHSACYEVPFTAYIIPYAKFDGLTYEEDVKVIVNEDYKECTTKTINGFAYNPNETIQVDICEEFCVSAYIEDIFATMLNCRTVFKNVTVFLLAKPVSQC